MRQGTIGLIIVICFIRNLKHFSISIRTSLKNQSVFMFCKTQTGSRCVHSLKLPEWRSKHSSRLFSSSFSLTNVELAQRPPGLLERRRLLRLPGLLGELVGRRQDRPGEARKIHVRNESCISMRKIQVRIEK